MLIRPDVSQIFSPFFSYLQWWNYFLILFLFTQKYFMRIIENINDLFSHPCINESEPGIS